jgi:DNA-binding NarL/FixJ family response regulator
MFELTLERGAVLAVTFVIRRKRIGLKRHQTVVAEAASRCARDTRILVVDDSPTMRRSLRRLLESHDHWKVCDEASDGREAIQKFGDDKFDVIVLDFQMPVMDGLTAAKHITSRCPDTPILMVTMHASSQLAHEARKAGIRGVCAKADIQCVVEGVATILENKSYFQSHEL